MRILGLATIIGALALAQAAVAAGYPPCRNSCYADFGTTAPTSTDYTVPDDGLLYDWNFSSDSAHPDVLIHVQPPNEVFGFNLIATGDGAFRFGDESSPWYSWREVQQPGFTLVQVRGQPSFNDCAGASAGQVCGYSSNIWGNGTSITVNTNDPVRIFVTSNLAVPEPHTWLLILSGFLGVGAAVRLERRRRTRAPAQA